MLTTLDEHFYFANFFFVRFFCLIMPYVFYSVFLYSCFAPLPHNRYPVTYPAFCMFCIALFDSE